MARRSGKSRTKVSLSGRKAGRVVPRLAAPKRRRGIVKPRRAAKRAVRLHLRSLASQQQPAHLRILRHLGNLLSALSDAGAGEIQRTARVLRPTAAAAPPASTTGKSPSGSLYTATGNTLNVGGDRNWRNNNPGNIEYGSFAKNHGAVGTDGRFAIFPDAATGNTALQSLLSNNYGTSTIAQMMQHYAPPNENNTENYIKFIEKQTGLSRDTVVGQLTVAQLASLGSAINSMEGGHAGTSYDRNGDNNPKWVDSAFDNVAPAGGGEGEGEGEGEDELRRRRKNRSRAGRSRRRRAR